MSNLWLICVLIPHNCNLLGYWTKVYKFLNDAAGSYAIYAYIYITIFHFVMERQCKK